MTFVTIDIYNQHMEKLTTTINEMGKRIRQLDAVEVPVGGGVPVHNLLSVTHSDTVVNGATRGSLIYGNATPAWDELVHPGINRHLQTDATDVLWRQDIYMNNGAFVGITGDVRIKFDTTNGRIDAILGDAAGADEFRVCDSSTAAVFTVDSDGNIYSIGSSFDVGDFSPTFGGRTLTVPATGTAVLAGASGASPRIAYWTNAYTIDGDAGLTIDAANNAYLVSDAGGIGNTFATAFLGFNSAGVPDYAYFSGCYVGINDTTPSFHLDVNGIIGIGGVQTIYNAGALSASYTGTLYLGNGGGALAHGGGTDAYYNTAGGTGALYSNTTGESNTAFGNDALYTNTTGELNSAFGWHSLYNCLGGLYNDAHGADSLYSLSSGSANAAAGLGSLAYITTTDGNVGIGYYSGAYISGGINPNQTGEYSVFIGYDTRALANGQANQIVIGANATGNGANTTTIGHTTITDCYIRGNVITENLHFVGLTGDARTVYDSTNGRIDLILGDAAGADEVRVIDSGAGVAATIDSDGNGYFAGLLGVGVAPGTYAISATLNAVTLQRLICTTASSANSGSFTFLIEDDGAAMSSGDRLGGVIIGGARDAVSTYSSSASVEAYAAENWGAAASGSEMRLYTTPAGSTTRAERIRITEGGNVGMNTTPNLSGFGASNRVFSIQGNAADNAGIIELIATDLTGTNRLGEIRFINKDGTAGVVSQAQIRAIRDGDDAATALTFYTDSIAGGAAERMRISEAGNVGVNVTPAYRLHVSNGSPGAVTPSVNADDAVIQNSVDAGITIACPDANVGRVAFGTPTDGYAAVISWDYTNALMRVGTAMAGADLVLQTANGTEQIRILSTGNVGINVVAPGAKLHVDQSSSTGAIPVLTLDQADQDYVLCKFIGYASAASADRTFVSVIDFPNAGNLVGWIQIEIQDDGNRLSDGDYYMPIYESPT